MTKIILNLPTVPDDLRGGILREALLNHVREHYDNTATIMTGVPTDLDTVLAEVRKLAQANTHPLVLEVDPNLDPETLEAIQAQAAATSQHIIMLERGGPVRLAAATPGPSREDFRALDRAVGEQVRKIKDNAILDDLDSPLSLLDDLYDLVADTVTAWANGRAPESTEEAEGEEPNVPETAYGVQLHFADETVLDVDNIDGVQVYEKGTHRFPFGFLPIVADEETAEVEHRAGYFRPEDGEFVPFSGEQAPRPFNSFGG